VGRRDGHLRLARALGARPPEAIDRPLAELARREGLAPLLGTQVVCGETTADGAATEILVHAHREELARGLVRSAAFRPLGAALADARIPFLLLKGAALERMIYRPGQRPMNDIDFLVAHADFPRSRAIAASLGAWPIGPRLRPLTRSLEYAEPMAFPPGVGIEIHRAVCPAPLFAVDAPGLFARAARCDDGALIPDPVDLFLILAIHAAKHGFSLPFRAVVDGLRLAAAVPLDAATLVRRGRAFRAGAAVSAWVSLLEAFGLDPAFAAAVRDALGRPAAAAGRLLARSAPWPADAGGFWRRARVTLSAEPLRGVGWLVWRSGLLLADGVAARLHG
jgi:hypothetical protein